MTLRSPRQLNSLVVVALSVFTFAFISGCKKEEPSGASTGGTQTTTVAHKHDTPGEKCFICDPSLREKGRLWCKEHDRYEDRCWLCHPDQEDKSRLFCKEHSLYEDECFLCHPELKKDAAPAGDKPSAPTSAKPSGGVLMCKEHGVAEQECGICHPELLTEKAAGQGLKVRLPSESSAANAGVVVGRPDVGRMQHGVESFAELMFDQNRLAQITPLARGVIKTVEVDLGSRVEEGQLLATITSTAISEAQAAYIMALAQDRLRDKTLERERNLHAQRVSAEQDLQEAEAAHESSMAAVEQAKQQLMVLGFDEKQIQAVAERKSPAGLLEIRAPFAGEIVERTAVRGALAEVGDPLFTLTDTAALWAMVNIPESRLAGLEVGQKVQLTIEALPDQTFSGILTWVSAKVDERTRMTRGRVELANPDGQLKAQMFARALIITSNSDRAVVVPSSAVQNVSGTPVVFIQSSADLFEARPIRLGTRRNGYIEVMAGLGANEPIVIAGGFALKSQFLISRLGAGCVDD